MNQPMRRFWAAALAAIMLVACGGGDAPVLTIGPAGGTVTGANGAAIVVPAGALAQTVNLQITLGSAGAPALPAGHESAGAIYALTPHGTTFAVPVTVTIPFDPAQVPAGRSVRLLKTNAAQSGWEPVAGATVSGSMLTAQVSSLLWFGPALVPTLPTITTQPAADVPVAAGQSATFSVVAQANGAPLLTYQWQRNGNNIAGATAATYTLTNVTAGDSGARFSVVVGNGLGTVTSAEAVLTVSATGWVTVGGTTVTAGGPVRLGGLAVAPNGRVGVAYVVGSSGIGGLVGELRVSEWNGTSWTQVGGALNLTTNDQVLLGFRSIVYDRTGRPVVAWINRLTEQLVLQSWTGTQWERHGNPAFSSPSIALPPQLAIDPASNSLLVSIAGRHPAGEVSVREWTGTLWLNETDSSSSTGSTTRAPRFGGGGLIVLNGGQRLLALGRSLDAGHTQYMAQLYAPNADVIPRYIQTFGPEVVNTPFANPEFTLSLATEGTRPYVLVGAETVGPMLVWNLSGSAWGLIGGDTGIRNTGGMLEMRVTPSGLPLIAYQQGATPSRRVDVLRWSGIVWNVVASPNPASVDVVGFALGLDPTGLPYVALAQRDPASPSQLASELVVRRFSP